MNSWWMLLLPVAATCGWYSAAKQAGLSLTRKKMQPKFHRKYLAGLNYLLNEQPDKAVDLFTKLIEVDSETIETHLALGNLFRRRGEVDRAIRIHQNLVAKPKLERQYKSQAVYALASDYMSAGVLDRAEGLFKELVDQGEHKQASFKALTYIYQQEKDWHQAITVAQKLAASTENNMRPELAHYHCELAEIALKEKDEVQALKYARRALTIHHQCVRASLFLSEVALSQHNEKLAIRQLQRILTQNPDWFLLAVPMLESAYLSLNKSHELIAYLHDVLDEFPHMPLIVTLSELIRKHQGDQAALSFVSEHVKENPSLVGIRDLLHLQLLNKHEDAREDLSILHTLTDRLVHDKSNYHCVNCGYDGNTLHWQCPSCKQWDTNKPAYLVDDD